MLRRVIGYALLAVVTLFALKIALGLFGFVLGLAITVAVLGALGYGCYLGLRVLAPAAADTVRELVTGVPTTAPPSGEHRRSVTR